MCSTPDGMCGMRERRKRILLLRSGRHLETALEALRASAPDCAITVVTTPAGIAATEAAGIPSAQQWIFTRTAFFEPWPFIRSGLGRQAARQRFDQVCVLWNDPEGAGHGNVDRTALLVSPSGFTAITPDGRVVERRTSRVLVHEALRAVTSVCLMALLGLFVFLPARALRSIGVGRAC